MAAAPYPDGIVMGQHGLLQKMTGALFMTAGEQVIFGNIISAHGEKRNAVDGGGKAFAPFIFFDFHGQGTQTNAPLPGIDRFPTSQQCDGECVKRLFAQPVGPPQLRVFDH